MDRYDADLWSYLKGKTEQSMGISERVKLAQKFSKKFIEIRSKCLHRDLKPQNVLLNLTADGKWNGELEITDFGIGKFGREDGLSAGTSGWAVGSQFIGRVRTV